MTEATAADLAVSGAATPVVAAPPLAAEGRDDRIGQEPMVSQQLCEVQLLLDFVSGNSLRRLPDKAAAEAAGLDADWIEQLCRISWPPAGTPAAQAEEEALLVKVKDYLNTLAAPASGASVAFTLLVAQEDNRPDAEINENPENAKNAKNVKNVKGDVATLRSGQSGRVFSRGLLAEIAFPGLPGKARNFRQMMWLIIRCLGAWLLGTCLLSWYVALGNDRLGQHSAAVATLAQLAATPTLASEEGRPAVQPNPAGVAAKAIDLTACDTPAPQNGSPRPLCGAIESARAEVEATRINVRNWMRMTLWGVPESATIPAATSWLDVLGGAVLPVLYGVLGAAASVLRLLAGRMRLSLLMPRDHMLAVQQLALGAVVGACIGLFVSPPGADDANVFGTVSLSSSALSFIAGFGVEVVFVTLEAVIARVFNVAPPPPPARHS